MSTIYLHFTASQLVRKHFPAFPLHLPPSLSPHLFSSSKDEAVSQTGSFNILNITVPSSHLSPYYTLIFLFLPFYSFCPPSHPCLLLTGGGCSRQMLKCLVCSGFTRRRATRDSPMNSLCVSLSSSHTDTLGVRDTTGRGR